MKMVKYIMNIFRRDRKRVVSPYPGIRITPPIFATHHQFPNISLGHYNRVICPKQNFEYILLTFLYLGVEVEILPREHSNME